MDKPFAFAGGPLPAVAMRHCPRCNQPAPRDASFCNHGGAPFALWRIHSPEQGTHARVAHKAILAHPERCPTSAILRSGGGSPQTLRVPPLDENFEIHVPGTFIVGEPGGMGQIKTSINEGCLVADDLRRRIEKAGPRVPPELDEYDCIGVDAGPAGLSASLTPHEHGIRYLKLEQGEVASTTRNSPRHKFLMAEPLKMPLHGNLYIVDSTKESLLGVWETIISSTGVRIQTNEKVERIERDGAAGGLRVTAPKASDRTQFVVPAIGKRGTPRKLGVVGGGGSAIEVALGLAKAGRNRVTLVHCGADFTRARERNRELLDQAIAEGRVVPKLRSKLQSIGADSVVLDQSGSIQEVRADFIFVLIGGGSPDEFLRRVGVEIVEKAVAA